MQGDPDEVEVLPSHRRDRSMQAPERVRPWRPAVPGVAEVLHAHFTDHAYPARTHDHWTVLLVTPAAFARRTAEPPHLLGRAAQEPAT